MCHVGKTSDFHSFFTFTESFKKLPINREQKERKALNGFREPEALVISEVESWSITLSMTGEVQFQTVFSESFSNLSVITFFQRFNQTSP